MTDIGTLSRGAAIALAGEIMDHLTELSAMDTDKLIEPKLAEYLAEAIHASVIEALLIIRESAAGGRS